MLHVQGLLLPKVRSSLTVLYLCKHLIGFTENPTIEAVFASSAKEVDLYPSAYAYETRDNDPLKACKTKVIAEITTSMDLDGSGQKQTDDLRRINATCL